MLFKWPKETRDVSTFLPFQIFWIFLCRFPYLEVHYSENCALHCHQQSAPSSFFPPDFAIFSFKKWSLLYLEACSRPNHQHSKLILVGSRHLQPQENIYIHRNSCQESPNGGKIPNFFSGTRTPETLISLRKYFQSKYISTKNSGSWHEKYISTNNSGSRHEKYISTNNAGSRHETYISTNNSGSRHEKYISTNNAGSRHETYISTNNSWSWHEKYILGCETHQNVTLVVNIYFVKVKRFIGQIYIKYKYTPQLLVM